MLNNYEKEKISQNVIELHSNQGTFKITGATFNKNNFETTVEIKVHTTTKTNDSSNVGNILEKYRSIDAYKEEYYQKNKESLEHFINNCPVAFEGFIPDGVICILPKDKNRKDLLLLFKIKIQGETNPNDYSNSFTKKDENTSVKKDNLSVNDFDLNIKKDDPFQNLLIIDDVIDEGKTLNILLESLLAKNLINKNTNIKMSCIYNRPKLEKRVNPMDLYMERMNENKSH